MEKTDGASSLRYLIYILILFPLAGEIALRLKLNYFPGKSQPLHKVVEFDKDLGWDLKKEVHLSSEDRILVLGGSFTYGDGVKRKESWPGRFKYASNQGVSGYGLDQMYLKYLKVSKSYKGDKVFIGLIDDSFIRTAKSHFVITGHQKPQFDSKLNIQNSPVPKRNYRESYFDWKMATHRYYSELHNYFLNDKLRIQRGYSIGLKILEQLSDRVSLNGRKLFVVILGPIRNLEKLKIFFEENGIGFSNCSDYYKDSKYHLSSTDTHPNPDGHKWIARCIQRSYNL